MKRYLGGEELPPQLMEELEQHVHACASCSHYLDAQRLKLAAKLSGGKVKQVKEPKAPTGPKDSDVFTKPRQPWLTPKTMGLAAALALVLFAMSAVAKDPTLLFGPKASTTRPAGALKEDPEGESSHQADGEEAPDSDKSVEEETSGSESHSKVGEIMTGETVQREIEASQNDSSHEQPDSSHDSGSKESSGKAEDGHAPSHAPTVAPAKKPDSHSDAGEVHSEPAKEPDMALVVAEEGKAPKKAAPAPHPKAAPAKPKARRSLHRAPTRKPSSSHRSSVSRRSSKPAASGHTSGGSIRVYDSAGNPIN